MSRSMLECLPASPDSGSSLSFPSPHRTNEFVPTMGISELTPALGLDSSDNLYEYALKRVDAESCTFPALWRVEHLSITALVCSADSWRRFLRELTGLRVLEIDFERVSEEFWYVFMEREEPTTLGENKKPAVFAVTADRQSGWIGRFQGGETIRWRSRQFALLPSIGFYRCYLRSPSPLSRGMIGTGVSRWLVKWSERLEGRDETLDDLVHYGVWVKVEGKMLHKRVECWDEEDEEEELTSSEESWHPYSQVLTSDPPVLMQW